MTALPPSIDPSDEIAVNWNRDESGTTVTIELGDAKIVVQTNAEKGQASTLPWLIAALPNILEAAFDAIHEVESIQEET